MNEPNNDEKIKFQPLSLAGGPESGPVKTVAIGLDLKLQVAFLIAYKALFFLFLLGLCFE